MIQWYGGKLRRQKSPEFFVWVEGVRNMKIFIGVPTFENIFPDTFKSIYDLDKAGHECVFEFIRGYDVGTARNKMVLRAQELEADYIFMVDNDVVLPKDALINLLDDVRDVQLGYYVHRTDYKYDGRTKVCKLGEINYFTAYSVDELRQARERGEYKIRIHGGGMGCALINMDVYDQLPYPWYKWLNHNNRQKSRLSEDLFFCELCKREKIPVWTDSRVGCGHMLRHIEDAL